MSATEGCQAAATGNPALYCVDEKGDNDEVMTSEPTPAAPVPEVKAGPDFSTFDIVKATQYGAFDRVRHLIQVEVIITNV